MYTARLAEHALDMHPGFKWEAYPSTFGSPQKDHRHIVNFPSLKTLIGGIHLL